MLPAGRGAEKSPLKSDGMLNVRETNMPTASTSKMDKFDGTVSSRIESNFREWLRITFGSQKYEPTTPENL